MQPTVGSRTRHRCPVHPLNRERALEQSAACHRRGRPRQACPLCTRAGLRLPERATHLSTRTLPSLAFHYRRGLTPLIPGSLVGRTPFERRSPDRRSPNLPFFPRPTVGWKPRETRSASQPANLPPRDGALLSRFIYASSRTHAFPHVVFGCCFLCAHVLARLRVSDVYSVSPSMKGRNARCEAF